MEKSQKINSAILPPVLLRKKVGNNPTWSWNNNPRMDIIFLILIPAKEDAEDGTWA
jgi:hypothetical protein